MSSYHLQPISHHIFLDKLEKVETSLFHQLLEYNGFRGKEWIPSGGIPQLEEDEILLGIDIPKEIIENNLSNFRFPLLLGRGKLAENRRLGIFRKFDLDRSLLTEFPILQLPYPKRWNAILFSEDSYYSSFLETLLWDNGFRTHIAKDPSALLALLSCNEYRLMILDFQSQEIGKFIREMKRFSTSPKYPLTIASIDTESPELFRNLSSGVREICESIIPKNKILQYFKDSVGSAFLLEQKRNKSFMKQYLDWEVRLSRISGFELRDWDFSFEGPNRNSLLAIRTRLLYETEFMD